jgi:hypothetical protein
VARARDDYFDALAPLDEIDRLVTALDLRHPGVALARGGEPIEPGAFCDEDGRVDVARLGALHADGATLIINQVEDKLAPVADLCAALELAFSAPVQANLYLTPANEAGFAPHFDTHDVFVLQTRGRKLWTLYESSLELPLPAQAASVEADRLGPLLCEIELCAGDTLYVPRGVVHAAAAGDLASAHLTVGVLAYTWTDLIYEALAGVVLTDPAFRASLPRRFAGADFDAADAASVMGGLIRRFAEAADSDGAFEAVRGDFLAARRVRLPGQMTQLALLDGLGPDSEISPRPYLRATLRDEAEAIVIACPGKQIRIPRLGAEAIRFALSVARWRVRDLPGPLDDESRLAIVRRLVREGVLAIRPPIADGPPQD